MSDKIKLKDIQPAEYNPRSISEEELTKLENSISEFGLVDPIIINLKNNRIIGGHQRYKVLEKQSVKELNLIKLGDIGWCYTTDNLSLDSAEHEKALNLALNKIKGEWDNPKLENLIDELQEHGFNIALTGFEKLEESTIALPSIDDNDDFFDEIYDEDESFDFEESSEDYENESEENDENRMTISEKTLEMGNFKIILPLSKFMNWIGYIEKDCNFDNELVIRELKKRLGLCN